MPSIRGQSVLLIGGSSGIGAAVAKLAAEEGACVFIASSNKPRVDSAVSDIKSAHPDTQVEGFVVDVNTEDAEVRLETLLTKVVTANKGDLLDHIVYTAAVFDFKPISGVTADWLKSCMLTQFSLVVPMLLSKVTPRFVKSRPQSSLTFTTGRIAEKPYKGLAVAAFYSSGLFGLTKTLALEIAPIRVNLVSPGTTDTEMQGPPGSERRIKSMAAAAEGSILGKVGLPEEVGEAYLYLMKDSNNTGSTVSTSGGVLLQ